MSAFTARAARALLVFSFFLTAAPAAAQLATIEGRVYDAQARPVEGAIVTVVETRHQATTAADGSYRFEALPPRHYHIRAESSRLGSAAVAEAEIRAGQTLVVELVIDPLVHAEEIVVTASGGSRRESEVYQPVNALSEEELRSLLQPTLGETLAREPGVTSTSFGAGASRPVIRGLGADRIRVLEEGVGTGDASNVSPDHAVSVEPSAAERIEIVRGPATLLYGSNAIGGVVNVISARVPAYLPGSPLSGSVDLRYGSAAEEKANSVTLDGALGHIAWHADLSLRDTNDYAIPEPADPFDDPDHFEGTLENSSLQSRSGTLGGSWIGSRGFFGLALTSFTTEYGVPGHAEHGEEGEPEEGEEEEEAVRIDLEQRRIDLRGELSGLALFETIRMRVGVADYEHVELEGAEIGTRFTNDSWEGRLEGRHLPLGRLSGTWGVQLSSNDFVATGDEAYIPANRSTSSALFAFEELPGERFDVQFGARYERQEVRLQEGDAGRDFSGVSGSVGTIWRPTDRTVVALALARAVRLPTATELYANGPHAATRQFEIGNPGLDPETSLGLDLAFRRTAGRFRGELSLFNSAFDGFIFEAPTGEVEDGFGVFGFVQRDARFRGAELITHTHLVSLGGSHLELDLGADYVRATLAGGENLPRIPPLRASGGLNLHGGPVRARIEVRHTFEQNDIAPFETETGSFTFLNAHVGYRFFFKNLIHDVMLRGTNLTDQLGRSHVSALKDLAPLPGRDLTLSWRTTF